MKGDAGLREVWAPRPRARGREREALVTSGAPAGPGGGGFIALSDLRGAGGCLVSSRRCVSLDTLITDYFEGRETFWDPFMTPTRKLSPPRGTRQSSGAVSIRDVCVRLLQPTLWRTESIYFKTQKRCFDQPHLLQSWH